jgi:hypothetical protein
MDLYDRIPLVGKAVQVEGEGGEVPGGVRGVRGPLLRLALQHHRLRGLQGILQVGPNIPLTVILPG